MSYLHIQNQLKRITLKMTNFIKSDVLTYISDFVIIINLNGKINFINPAFKQLSRFNTDLIGQDFNVLLKQLDIKLLDKESNDVQAYLPLKDIEHVYKINESISLNISWSFFPLFNDKHSLEEIALIGKDITELKQLSLQVERLDNIIKYAPDWIYWKDKNLTYLGCNERFAKAAGYLSPEDIIGKSDQDLMWHQYAKKYNLDDQEVINTGAPKFGNEDLVPLGDGSRATVISNKVPLRDAHGNTIGVLGISTDITEQKKTEEALHHAQAAAEELERLDTIIKYAPDWIYWKDKNLVYLGCNDQLAIAAGYSNRNDMIGKSDFDLPWHEHATKYRMDDKEVIDSGKPKLNIEEIVIVKDCKKAITITNKVPLRGINGDVIGVLGIATDITNRKKTEKELIKARATEKVNTLKTHFIQNMQHDIRTPASSMSAVLEELVKNNQLPDHELLALLRDSAKQLHRICSEVIDFDRIEYGDRPILSKKIAIRKLVSMVFELNQIAAYEKGLKLFWVVDEKVPKVAKGDEHRVSRILINLIGNALKFTPEGSVSLSVHLIQERDKEYIIQFKLQDTGIGIPLEKQTSLYEKFNRLTPSNQGLYSGSGLGLRIVKKYVDELKGEISVDSELNQGTTFYIDIPFEKALVETIYQKTFSDQLPSIEFERRVEQSKLASVMSSSTLINDEAKYNVLFIEDNPAAMKVGTFFLHSMNYKVTVTTDVEKSLQVLEKNKFDFIVSDIGLPDGTGIDIINAVKRNANSINFYSPFFALTANADQGTITEAENAGFLYVMIKPMQKELIQSLVEQYLVKKVNISSQSKKNHAQQLIGLDLPTNEGELFQLKQYPLLDVKDGLTLLGDEVILREILSELVKDLPQNKMDLLQAYDNKNWSLMERLAHKIKGGADYVGTIRMKYACQYLESYHKAGYSKCLEALYQQLIEVLNETQIHINSWLKDV